MYGPQVYDFVQHMTVRNWIRRKRDIVTNAVMTLKIIQLCFFAYFNQMTSGKLEDGLSCKRSPYSL